MKNVNAYTGPQRFAHRGLVQAAPENTLGAFQGAVDGGYEGPETARSSLPTTAISPG